MAYYRFELNALEASVPGITTHPAYEFAIEDWEKIRDVIQGSRFVKARKTRYLPALFDQEDEDYNRYLERAVFFNATRRTRDAMVGLILRKTPEVTMDADVERLQGDVDMRGSTLDDYIHEVAEEVSSMGRCGTFVDWSDGENRPYFSFYHTEDIIDWEERRIDGKMRLTRLVLREKNYERREDSNAGVDGHALVETIRVYELRDNVVFHTKREIVEGNVKDAGDEMELKHRGGALDFIPFVFHGVDGNKPDIALAPLSDLVDVNISHFQTSADLENGRHVAGLPTPYACGFDSNEEFVLGTSHAWVSDQADATAGFIEFTGQGLQALENAMKEKQQQMAALGARMLEVQKSDAEAYETVQLRANSEQATLIAISGAVSATMSKALQLLAWWNSSKGSKLADLEEGNVIVLNTDFVAAKMDGPTLTALVSAFQSGTVSWQTFYHNLEQGEFYPDDWSADEEQRLIEQTPPSVRPPAPTAPTDPNDNPDPGGGGKPPAKKAPAKKKSAGTPPDDE